ncbi:DNA topoisomerase OS=Ureibacillus acetophenoni OX=614649 GN=SAMN05877842_103240 PE=3 SV=1 [Ureibacillus acetophenoni]
MKIAQSLYEKKLITYPRTESKHLPTSFAKSIEDNIKHLANIDEYREIVTSILQNKKQLNDVIHSKRYVDDKKLTDHHAITVTDVPIGRKSLTANELKIYHLISKRLLSIFMPPYVIDKTTAILESNNHYFKANGNMVIQKGYTILYESYQKNRNNLYLTCH